MGLVTKNNNELDDSIGLFFNIPIEEKNNNYDDLKEQIYKLDIDNEEKANIISKINSINDKYLQNKEIIAEINRFKEKYNL